MMQVSEQNSMSHVTNDRSTVVRSDIFGGKFQEIFNSLQSLQKLPEIC